jgi:hypothetical protein
LFRAAQATGETELREYGVAKIISEAKHSSALAKAALPLHAYHRSINK